MLVSLELPPGIYKNGTRKQSEGRYYEGNLIRFQEGAIKPVHGWRKRSQSAVTGVARELVIWKDNIGQDWAGIGTHSNLYVMTQSGVLNDITPADFTAGRVNARNGGGYGSGPYGEGVYGLPIVGTDSILPASVWSLDIWAGGLVGVMRGDNTIYEWNTGDSAATPLLNAPTAQAILVTDQRIMLALGADSNARRVAWSDIEKNTVWTPAATNSAGGFNLQTVGDIVAGVKIPGGAIIFTDTDLHRFEFIGGNEVFDVTRVKKGSGAISQNCAVEYDGRVIWMSHEAFWSYNGYAQPLPCDVSDDLFSNINRAQISKVSVFHNSAYGEIWWFYPSGNSLENNRYVSYSYRENTWSEGDLARLCATDMSPFPRPLMAAADGFIYEHEIGDNIGDHTAFLRGGPLELGQGDNTLTISSYIPDTDSLGDATFSISARFYPMGETTLHGPYIASEKTDFMLSGREFEVVYEGAPNTRWRIGNGKCDVRQRGKR